jgi:hypothetical protein
MKAIVTFQGFTESIRQRTGTEDLYFNVIRQFAGPDCTTFQPQPWTANVKAMADLIARQGIRHVAMVSYSHGQAAATDFAERCYSNGVTCNLWCACDPVYRPAWLPRKNIFQPLAFRALGTWAKIKVPANVWRVVRVQQTISRPQGHELKATGHKTYIEKPVTLPYSHTAIDHAPEWYNLVRTELQHWTNPPAAEPV